MGTIFASGRMVQPPVFGHFCLVGMLLCMECSVASFRSCQLVQLPLPQPPLHLRRLHALFGRTGQPHGIAWCSVSVVRHLPFRTEERVVYHFSCGTSAPGKASLYPSMMACVGTLFLLTPHSTQVMAAKIRAMMVAPFSVPDAGRLSIPPRFFTNVSTVCI